MYILIGYFIMSMMFIGLFVYESNLLHKLEEETHNKINYYMIESNNNKIVGDEMEKIMGEYRDKQHEIQEKTMINGIAGFCITLMVSITSINKMIKDVRKTWMQVLDEDEGKDDEQNENEGKKNSSTIEAKNCDYERIGEMIEEICSTKEKNKEMEELVEKILTLFMKQFTQILEQTTHFTDQINQDRNSMLTNMKEIRQGVDQIGQVLVEKQKNKNTCQDEEIIVAVEQINTAIEEIGQLLMEMEGKIKHLSNNTEKYNLYRSI
ncbi:MAG: hypothetical protein N4A62_13350 [Marinisporobacter sp.]|nr:hypothetical protein [Marinisporobacter sp.]